MPLALKNPSIQTAVSTYLAKQAGAASLAALASDACDWIEAAAAAGKRYSGHRVTVKGGSLFLEGALATRATIEANLASGCVDAADVSALLAEVSALFSA